MMQPARPERSCAFLFKRLYLFNAGGCRRSFCLRSRQISFPVDSQCPKIAENVGAPEIDIMLLDIAAHPAHPLVAFRVVHLEAEMNRIGHGVDVIWVDEESIMEFDCRSSEAAQDEHAVLIVARGDEFLGYQ